MKLTKNHEIAIAFIATAIFAGLLIIAHGQDQANLDKLASLHEAELTACMKETAGTGETCRIEYLKDRTDTVYAAKVVREAK